MSGNDSSGQFVQWRPLVQLASKRMALTLLPGVLYGIFALLTFVCFYLLLASKSTTRTVRLLLGFTLFALWGSTTAFLVWNTLTAQYANLQDGYITWSSQSNSAYDGDDVVRHIGTGVCGVSASLTINVFLANAVMWWRTCALWRGRARWPVRVVGGILVLAGFGSGIANVVWVCGGDGWDLSNSADLGHGVGFMYEALPFDVVSFSLSLAVNIIATALAGFKAWRYRSSLKKHIEAGSRLEKVAILLVESGLVYSLLWIVFVTILAVDDLNVLTIIDVYGIGEFWTSSAIFLQGGLVPLIAIYPTALIILVALNRSQVEKEFWTSRLSHVATTAPVDSGSGEMATHDRRPILEK